MDPGAVQAGLDSCAAVLTQAQPGMNIVVTAGRRGAYAYADGIWDHCPALTAPVARTAGAGDALLGGVVACLAAGVPLACPGWRRAESGDEALKTALDFGVLLAAFSVTSPHTIHPKANLGAPRSFAADRGLRFGAALQSVVGCS